MCLCSPAGGKSGSGCLFFSSTRVAVHEDMRDEAGGVGQRDPPLLHGRRLGPGGDGQVERVVGGLDVLRQVDMRDVEGVAVLVEAVGRAVGGKRPCRAMPGRSNRSRIVFSYSARGQPAQRGPALARSRRARSASMRPSCQPGRHRRGFPPASGRACFFGGISPGCDAVMDLHPAGEVSASAKSGFRRREIEVRPCACLRRGTRCSACRRTPVGRHAASAS